MRALIDGLEKQLKDNNEFRNCRIKAYGLSTDELPDPDMVPYINIKPRGKPRDREFFIGTTTKLYVVEPEIELHVWESSINSLREAFEACEELTERVLDFMANISAATLGVDWHEEQIESFEDDRWEQTFYYMAVILFKARLDEDYS